MGLFQLLDKDIHMERDNKTPEEMASALLAASGRIVIVAHVRPDGDAAGSALGLCLSLKAMGRNAVCVGLEPLGREFDFFEGLDEIIPAKEYTPEPGDSMAIVDCGDFSRISETLQVHANEIAHFCIDHHKSNAGFAQMQMIDPDASSTAELVYRIIKAGGMPITRGVAEALWVGVITDTGRFAYSNTTPESMVIASELLAAGVRSAMINDKVYCQVDLCRLRLLQRLLGRLEVSAGGKVCVVSLTAADYAAEGGCSVDSDNFVDVARSVKGTELSAFVRQVEPGDSVHVSLRTRGDYDAADICAEWGGGGHVRAAGASIKGEFAEVIAMVHARLDAIATNGVQ